MSRKPTFWIALDPVSLACAVFAYRYFPQAFPVLQFDISMDRPAALLAVAARGESL